jgi:mannosyltransferase OCH1-like enzyme
MIPRIIHQIWVGGDPLPEQYRHWHEALVTTNPDWLVVLWDDIRSHPIRDMSELWGKYEKPACVSNRLRLDLLYRFGGLYLDMDFEPISPIGDTFDGQGAVCAFQDGARICNAFLGAPPKHPWIKWQIDNFDTFDQKDPAAGVYLATAAPRNGVTVVSSHLVYPWMYDEPKGKGSVLAHHWHGSWTKK